MKKIPTLFERTFEGHNVVNITDKVTEGMEWVLNGEGTATTKYDGACCAVINGEFYKRYDAKCGKKPPEGAIPCCDPDPITGHHPHWVKVDFDAPENKWFVQACLELPVNHHEIKYATYEAVGEHFNGNPYDKKGDYLIHHGNDVVDVERSFEGIKKYLEENYIEGLVFWKDGEPRCKIKRSDFGFEWGNKR